MPDDNDQSQPAEPQAQQTPAEPPPKPPEPQNIVFKGGENPHETTVDKTEKSSEKR